MWCSSCTLRILKWFYALINYCGVLPHKTSKFRLIFLTGSIVSVMATTTTNIYLLAYRIANNHANMNSIYVYIDSFKIMIGIVSSISYLPHIVSTNPKWLKLLNIMDEVKQNGFIFKTKTFLILMIYTALCHVTITALWTKEHVKYINLTIVMKNPPLCFYYENLNAITMIIFVMVIKNKFKKMRIILNKLHRYQISSVSHIKDVKRLYLSGIELTGLVNSFFGAKILLSFANAAAQMLWVLVSFIQLWKPDKFSTTLDINWEQFVIALIFSLVGALPVCILTMICSGATKEIEYLIVNCYQLQDKFAQESYEYRELDSLWMYISNNRLAFTAVDFFKIEPPILLEIIASTTTYFIALIQFNY